MIAAQRVERTKLEQGLAARWKQEAKIRAERLHTGIRGVWELLTGKARAIRRQNESESFAAYRRDRVLREELYRAQLKERRELAGRMVVLKARHRVERENLTAKVVEVLRHARRMARDDASKERGLDHGAEREMTRWPRKPVLTSGTATIPRRPPASGTSAARLPLGTAGWTSYAKGKGPGYRSGDLWVGRLPDGDAIGIADRRHVLVVGGTRGGKGTTIIVPNLLDWPGSVVVLDPKGENAMVTARRRGRGSARSAA